MPIHLFRPFNRSRHQVVHKFAPRIRCYFETGQTLDSLASQTRRGHNQEIDAVPTHLHETR